MKTFPYINAGAMRHEIHVQSQAAQDAFGGPGAWADMYVAFGAIDTISSRQVNQANQFSSQVTHRITLRWPGEIGIKAGLRVVFGEGLLHMAVIQTVENVQMRNCLLSLMVQEIDWSE